MAGADLSPAPLAASTLVVIDAQNEYLDGKLALPGIAAAVDALARLLAKARAAGAPVVHVQHKGRTGGLFDLDARGGAIIGAVQPVGGESVVTKPLPNAFAGTDLEATLKRLGRSQLVIAGFMTHMCVSSTARAALDLGYKATVAADAAATRALPDPMGGVIGADALHRAALAALADRFAIVATVEQIPER
jgi:nicotinamidase-related amidase